MFKRVLIITKYNINKEVYLNEYKLIWTIELYEE